jgi:hypothetical protein
MFDNTTGIAIAKMRAWVIGRMSGVGFDIRDDKVARGFGKQT